MNSLRGRLVPRIAQVSTRASPDNAVPTSTTSENTPTKTSTAAYATPGRAYFPRCVAHSDPGASCTRATRPRSRSGGGIRHPSMAAITVSTSVRMQLKAHAPKSQGSRIYIQLRDQMSALPGFVKAFWARDVEYKRRLAVLTGQKHQALLMPRCLGASWLNDWRAPYLEFICFHAPMGVVERQLFEHAYGAFIEFAVLFLLPSLP